jgi:MFS family permease
MFLVKDTTHFVHAESLTSKLPIFQNVWKETTWKHRNLGSVSLTGLVNNLNDGVVWGLLPMLLIQRGFEITQIGIIAAIYPAVWGISQLFTGKMGDTHCKKQIITAGMLLQALAILMVAIASALPLLILASMLLGFGTALVYPNFLSVIAESTHPKQRAESLSIFRLWRDSGYVFGALLSGVLADAFGITSALFIIAGITAMAGLIANKRMCCTAKTFWQSDYCLPAY